MTPHGFINDTDKELKDYKSDNAEAWKKILGGGDFQIVEEDHDDKDITSFTVEPE